MATISARTRTNKAGESVQFFEARIKRKELKDPLSKSFPTRKAAEIWARDIESKIDKGAKTFTFKADKTPVSAAISEYIESKKITGNAKLALHQVGYDFRKKNVGELSWQLLQTWIETLEKTPVSEPTNRKKYHPLYNGRERKNRCYSSGSIRQFYFKLKVALEWHAREHNYLLPQFLFQLDAVPRAWETPRERRLVDDEEERLMKAAVTGRCNQDIWPYVIKILIETASRRPACWPARCPTRRPVWRSSR
jgi:hypothetical protein